jgi:hypothetical protein
MRVSIAVALVVCLAAQVGVSAQEAIRTRAVRIIEGDTPTSAPATPAPTKAPVLPDAILNVNNPAGISIEVLPGSEVAVGTTISFRVSVEKPGYLVVVDVDSSGRLTQIYPNTQSLANPNGVADKANFLERGKPRVIPDPRERTSFRFVAAPPTGVDMLVAILSDKPVQMIDLPDVPAALAGRASALEYVKDTTIGLKILPATDTGTIREPKWSFATKFYVIK